MGALAWPAPLVLAVVFVAPFAVLFVVLNSILLVSGAYQVLTGKPSLLVRIVATVRMRLPATPADCILQGAAQVLHAVGLFVGIGVVILPAVASTSGLIGAPQLPRPEGWLAFVFLAYALASLVIAIVCAGVSL